MSEEARREAEATAVRIAALLAELGADARTSNLTRQALNEVRPLVADLRQALGPIQRKKDSR